MKQAFAIVALTPFVLPAQVTETEPIPPKKAESARFGWPVPGSVRVKEKALKKGKRAEQTYRLVTAADKASGDVLVCYKDFQMTMLAGLDLTDERVMKAVGKQIAPALALAKAIPDVRVGTDGEFKQVIGIEALMDRVAAFQAKAQGMSEAEAAKVREIMKSPSMKSMMRNASSRQWMSWVGGWIGWDVKAGQNHKEKTTLPLGAVQLPAVITRTNHGPVEGKPGYVKLSVVTVAEGEGARRAMMKMVTDLMKQAGNPPPPEDAFRSVRTQTKVVTVTRLDTLQPLSVLFEHEVSILEKGKTAPREQLERREYAFEWSRAEKK